MNHLVGIVQRLHFNESRGATVSEYSLIISLIAIAIFGAVTLLGETLGSLFENPDLTNVLGS